MPSTEALWKRFAKCLIRGTIEEYLVMRLLFFLAGNRAKPQIFTQNERFSRMEVHSRGFLTCEVCLMCHTACAPCSLKGYSGFLATCTAAMPPV